MLPDMSQIISLHQLKLEADSSCVVDMCGLSGLQHVESICLVNMQVRHPDVLAELNLTSLTLCSVEREWQSRTGLVEPPEGVCWPKLKRVQLGGCVSEQLLQDMQLPNATDRDLNVTLRCDTFDHFAREHDHRTMPGDYGRPFDADLTYQADTLPILGPSYFAAAQITSVKILGDYDLDAVEQMQEANVPLQELYLDNEDLESQYGFCEAGSGFPALQKLGLVASYYPSVEQWCDWLKKCPLLTHVVFKGIPHPLNMIYMNQACELNNLSNLQAAADRLGMSLKREPDLYVHCFVWCEICIVRP